MQVCSNMSLSFNPTAFNPLLSLHRISWKSVYWYTSSPCLCTTTYNICARHFQYLVRPRPWMANPLWSTLTFRFRGWRQIHETDKGSKPQLACVQGWCDWYRCWHRNHGAGAICKSGCHREASQEEFRKPDRVPWTYDGKRFIWMSAWTWTYPLLIRPWGHVHGQLLLLSEGVCRKLGIVSYHPSVSSGKSSKKTAAIVPTGQI